MAATLVDIEGLDGSGKTTAIKTLCSALLEMGFRVLETREVGSQHVPFASKLREIVLDPANKLDGTTMELLFAAMRIESQKEYRRVSEDYDFIVSDRGYLSHLAYTDHNVNEDFTKDFYLTLLNKYLPAKPDHVLYLSVDPEVALRRRMRRGEVPDAIEIKGVQFQTMVGKSFKKYLRQEMGNIDVSIIDANKTAEEVRSMILEYASFLARGKAMS
jgi:dTMP kinase